MMVLSNVQKILGAFRLSIEHLEIQPGEYLVILGPSGAGKSVLLLTIAGLIRPDAGRIFFDGTNVTGLPAQKRDVGLVFQEANLFPHLNVADNIAFGKRYRRRKAGEIGERIEVLVDMLDIRHLLHRGVETLSGGEKQRAAVARALAIGPTILLMDEPLGLLDQNTREELRKELRRVHDELGTTTLHVTHDRSEAFAIADRIAILNDGQIAQVGTRDEIFAEPASEFVARFTGMENIFKACLEPGATRETFLIVGESHIPIATERHGEVRVCIRPEAISIYPGLPAGVQAERLISGAVKSVEDKGTIIRVVVSCSLGDVVVFVAKQYFSGGGLSFSSSVWLEFDPGAIHILPTTG